MNPNLRTKAVIILGVILICAVGLTCFEKGVDAKTRFRFPTSLTALRENVSSRINLGLDLRGGIHLILQVQVDEAVNAETDQVAERLKTLLREQDIRFEATRKTDPTHVQVLGIPLDQIAPARDFLQGAYGGDYILGTLSGEQSGLVLEMTPAKVARIHQDTLRASITTLDRRVNALGVAEPVIAEHGRGEWEILVQLPGVDDPARVKSILQSTALLEIKLVHDGPFATEADALGKYGGILPPDAILVQEAPAANRQSAAVPQWYLIDRSAVVSGTDLRTARAELDPETGTTYQVSFSLSRDAAARFGPFTERNINRPLCIVLDNKIRSVANIKQRIEDSGRITGTFSLQEASDLALVLQSGALPASIKYLEERAVGPSLGADSIRAGFTAVLAGFAAVVVFMFFYYRLSGVNAFVSLLLNLLILMAALAYAGATLTLPGIAGILLTIGMAVDANVLVFERIREELRAGKGVVSAVENGFDRAFVTIFDTNATTIIAALFLFSFGTGPIRGFAITLGVGLVANVFAAVYVSRAMFEFILGRQGAGRPATLSI
ncbi:MAG: protein translocase subunit SecD [Candidatus Acidiferrales bacterium]